MFNQEDLQGVEEQQDRLGGQYTLDSGLYDATIKLAYVINSQSSQAKAVVTVLDINGFELTTRTWVTNSAGKPTYEKNNKKFTLPGYESINDMCFMATGISLAEQTIEDKTIKVWDAGEQKEVDKNMPVITSVLGKPVTVGVLKVIENKQKKGDDGKYHDTNEKREVNEIDKFFHTETKMTTVEAMKRVKIEPADLFYTKWGEKNTGETRDKFKEVSGAAPTSGSGAPPKQSKSLFS